MTQEEEFDIKCPKCGCRRVWAIEVIEAASEHFIDNGVWKHEYDNNEYGNGLRIEFRCDECGHKWRGAKGVTIDAYRKEVTK